MEHLAAVTHCLAQRIGAGRHDHEFLQIDAVVRVRATVDDIHLWHRQAPGGGAAEVPVERLPGRVRRCLRTGERNAEDGVGAEIRLVGGAVEFDHAAVDLRLLAGIHAEHRGADAVLDVEHGLLDALAVETLRVAVTQFQRLARTGRGTGGHRRAADGAVVEDDIALDGRVATRIDDLAGEDVADGGQVWKLPLRGAVRVDPGTARRMSVSIPCRRW